MPDELCEQCERRYCAYCYDTLTCDLCEETTCHDCTWIDQCQGCEKTTCNACCPGESNHKLNRLCSSTTQCLTSICASKCSTVIAAMKRAALSAFRTIFVMYQTATHVTVMNVLMKIMTTSSIVQIAAQNSVANTC